MFRSASRSPAPIEAVEVETLDAEPAPMPGRPGTPGANPHEKPDYLREVPFNMNDLRFGEFTIAAKSGSAGIAPERVFHDGRYTILDFGQGVAGDNTPIVDVAEVVDGIDSTVNVQIGGPTGNFIIIESVGDFRLRNGQRVVCITYNGPES
jgi:type IV secretory pathway VirB9-like protein